MAVELWIDDGNPWYLSPDIWVVPGSDPFAAPGQPVEDEPAYLWARLHNRGENAVDDAIVRYYWADPSTQVTRASAVMIGTSSASLAVGETKEVLCLTQWVPQYVNAGHECLIAEAFSPADPLPPHAPTDPFNVPTDRHVAQRNIGVAQAAAGSLLIFPFVGGAAFGHGQDFIHVRREPLETLKPLVEPLGLTVPEEAPEFEVGIRSYRGGHVDEIGEQRLELDRKRPRRSGMALVGAIPDDLPAGSGALFVIEQMAGDDLVGGLAVLAVSASYGNGLEQSRRPARKSRAS